MISFGKHITQKNDPMKIVEPEWVYNTIRQPDEALQTMITRLRLVKTIEKKQYGSMKRELPYVVCGIFNPPFSIPQPKR
ncbi:hypothetical protein FACS1894177_09840 [Bacteroidia bacterium]|nr:hypothetical protein FACS1894177_09840 [Bacteroidia bacterium]